MSQLEYDTACAKFTDAMRRAAEWKHAYFGAAYTTRLVSALQDARDACNELEAELGRLGELR